MHASISPDRNRDRRPPAAGAGQTTGSTEFDVKTSLDHLPPAKRNELEHIVAVLKEEFETARVKGDQRWRRSGKILKIVLFGSFARGDWVDEPENGYQSDWDLLIIVNNERLTAIEDIWWDAEERLLNDDAVLRPVNIIVHTLAQVNEALKQGGYFWVDLVCDGVILLGSRLITNS